MGLLYKNSDCMWMFKFKTPLIDELIFRELVNNAINAQYDNNITFLAYSTFLYCFGIIYNNINSS